jgi:diaminopimelate epimerase
VPEDSQPAETPFHFLSGNGNDFIALTAPTPLPDPEQVAAWCRRGLSMGADGVLHLSQSSDGSVRLGYWNADGGRSEFCFNGTRAAAQLASRLGWCRDDRIEIETDAGRFCASILSDSEVEIDAPIPPMPEALAAHGLELEPILETARASFVTVGVPHLVIARVTAPLDQLDVDRIGSRLRHHALFPNGTNVDFVRFESDRHGMEIRTYERGVEAETLACGSGVIAAAWVGLTSRQLSLPIAVSTRGGFAMQVTGESDDDALPTSWRLRGDARVIAQGTLTPGALTTGTLGGG